MQATNYPVSRQANIVIQEVNNEVLLYDLSINKAFCLNQTSSMIWNECDGKKDVKEISQAISKKLKLNVSEDIVWLAVHQFKNDNLLANSNEFVTIFDGLSRRDIVKRIGFASMVAFPVISSVVAPSAVHAASTTCGCSGTLGTNSRDAGCPCLIDSDCCGNCLSNGAMFVIVLSDSAQRHAVQPRHLVLLRAEPAPAMQVVVRLQAEPRFALMAYARCVVPATAL